MDLKLHIVNAPNASAYAGVNCQSDVKSISSASCFKIHVSIFFIVIILSSCYVEIISNGINSLAAWILFWKLLRQIIHFLFMKFSSYMGGVGHRCREFNMSLTEQCKGCCVMNFFLWFCSAWDFEGISSVHSCEANIYMKPLQSLE